MRKFTDKKLVLATHNKGKLAEMRLMFAPYAIEIVSAGELNLAEPAETENTFIGNATIKAKAAVAATGLPVLADDSGLCINGLNGDPGVYSANWGGPAKNFKLAMDRVQKELGDNSDRSAYFISVFVLAWPDGDIVTTEGRVTGTIIKDQRGDHGHGYDPIFVPDGETRTFAEMTMAEKGKFSHRARAFENLISVSFK
jgi:XTP/dITP diphosphohydrolase